MPEEHIGGRAIMCEFHAKTHSNSRNRMSALALAKIVSRETI
jgi:hypothetical protein